ncbi:peptidase M56 family protein [Arthrobacter sp. ISL-69]|uniref:peptidase M56 family protein n=1 Tax=Arthrobacter sp. ISL-69 TaxID=2819113 RepID=UPI001BE82CF0|nr:peptidase M56 family protein [Arthrobacter sp. ISL-69]MBT2537351.1 peptidase M56 family protein [Arthrobacter sp. ISL-69]
MNEIRVDDTFSEALRAELVSQVEKTSPARSRKRTRMWLGAGVLAGIGLLGGVGATAAGLFVVPGAKQVTPLSTPHVATYEGTATIELGDPPEGTTGIQMDFTCLTAGRFEYQDGSSSICSAADGGTRGGWSGYLVKLAPGQHSVTFTTDPGNRWQLTAKYVNWEVTDWAVNADGNTYGMENENGSPDMIAVMATNGNRGYAYRSELEEADGTAAMKTFKSPQDALDWQEARRGKSFFVPVYDADGKTVVGEFVVGPANGQVGQVPPQQPSLGFPGTGQLTMLWGWAGIRPAVVVAAVKVDFCWDLSGPESRRPQ